MSRDELIVLVGEQAERIAVQDGQITALATRIAGLVEANEDLAGRLARVEHLLSRNSQNSSSPPSKDDEPGKSAPRTTPNRHGGGPKMQAGQAARGAGFSPGLDRHPRRAHRPVPHGRCECGNDLAAATDLGWSTRCTRSRR